MKGYKGFNKGLVCRGKQYAENTTFEEDEAVICEKGMHFCENPLAVFEYYPPVDESGNLNEYAEVEADEVYTDDNIKYCTKKLHIGAKIGIPGLVKAFVDFTLAKSKGAKKSNTGDYSAATNTGYCSAATNTGYRSAATNTGDYSAATNTGDYSAASVEGCDCVAMNMGIEGKAKGALGCYIALAEWEHKADGWNIKAFKSHKVDGKTVKPDTFYQLINGKFKEVK